MVCLDTQLLLPLVVGLSDIRYLRAFSRTRDIDGSRFRCLSELVGDLVLTPLVLTEVDYFLTEVPSLRAAVTETLVSLLGASEFWTPEADAVVELPRRVVRELGLADSSLVFAADLGRTVATTDVRLAAVIAERGGRVVDPLETPGRPLP